jgi:hypothetical protein
MIIIKIRVQGTAGTGSTESGFIERMSSLPEARAAASETVIS